MRFLHTSDLHIGKMIEGWDLYEDTVDVLSQVVDICREKRVQCLLISGDVFDRSVPSERALGIYTDFLKRIISEVGIPVLAIAGNHDSGVRLGAYSELLERTGSYYVAGELKAEIKRVTLQDEFGPVEFYLLPFFKPVEVASLLHKDTGSKEYTDDEALVDLLATQDLSSDSRKVLLAHCFVAGYEASGSETFSLNSVAGVGNIAVNRFDAFDYVALGHIHRPMSIGKESIRYSGSLLKYKVSECSGPDRSVCVVDMDGEGKCSVEKVKISPSHPLREVSDTFDNLLNYPRDADSFVFAHLKDTEVKMNSSARLSAVFPRIVSIDYPNIKMEGSMDVSRIAGLTTEELIAEFYKAKTGQELDDEDRKIVRDALEQIEEEAE